MPEDIVQGAELGVDVMPSLVYDYRDEVEWRPAVGNKLAKAHDSPNEFRRSPEEEREKLAVIKAFFDQDLDDDDFRNRLDEIKPFLPEVFSSLKGREQYYPHEDIDPYDHTFNALNKLDTSELTAKERSVARVVLLFHDIGKVRDAKDREHPRHSVNISKPYLQAMGYEGADLEMILTQIKWHDLLGEIARRDGHNTLSVNDALHYFTTPESLRLHYKIASADVGSIPGLRKYLGNIDATYDLLQDALLAKHEYLSPRDVPELPFAIPDLSVIADNVEAYKQENIGESRFNLVDVWEEVNDRKNLYENLVDENENETHEQALIASSINNNELMLRLLHIMGRETDREFVKTLEQKYNVPLDQLRIAVELFSMTYHMWESSDTLKAEGDVTDINFEYYSHHIAEVVKSAELMSNYRIVATHRSPKDFAIHIDETNVVKRSVSDIPGDYQGDGVYVGIGGSYKDWIPPDSPYWEKDMKIYTFPVTLADTAPTIVSYNYPKSMANVLCEGLDIEGHGDSQVSIPRGLVEWRMCEFDNDPISQKKLDLFEKHTRGKVNLVTDEFGLPAIVLDSNKEPIVWASIARALRIRRVIPLAEVSKTQLPSVQSGRRVNHTNINFDGVTASIVDSEIDEERNYLRIFRLEGKRTRKSL